MTFYGTLESTKSKMYLIYFRKSEAWENRFKIHRLYDKFRSVFIFKNSYRIIIARLARCSVGHRIDLYNFYVILNIHTF